MWRWWRLSFLWSLSHNWKPWPCLYIIYLDRIVLVMIITSTASQVVARMGENYVRLPIILFSVNKYLAALLSLWNELRKYSIKFYLLNVLAQSSFLLPTESRSCENPYFIVNFFRFIVVRTYTGSRLQLTVVVFLFSVEFLLFVCPCGGICNAPWQYSPWSIQQQKMVVVTGG